MFILLLTSFVFANTINLGTTSNTKPTITAYYQQDESKGRSVIITSSNLERLSPSPTSGIPTSMVKVSDFRYKFTPVNDLTNGDYKLTVKSADSFGNSGEDALFLFTVNRAINIILDKPKGVSTTVPYDVQVNTTVSARCKYSDASVTDFNTQGTLFDFESSTSLVTIHLLRNTLRNKNTFVICQDAFGNTEQKTFFLGFDATFNNLLMGSLLSFLTMHWLLLALKHDVLLVQAPLLNLKMDNFLRAIKIKLNSTMPLLKPSSMANLHLSSAQTASEEITPNKPTLLSMCPLQLMLPLLLVAWLNAPLLV